MAIFTDDVDALDLIWGVEAISRKIKRTPRQTHHLITTGALPSVRKIGNRHVATETGLREDFGAVRKEAA